MKTTPTSSQNSCLQSPNFCKGARITLVVLGALLLLSSILGFLKVNAFSNMGALGSGLAASGAFVCLVLAYFCKHSPKVEPNVETNKEETYDEKIKKFFNAFTDREQAKEIRDILLAHPERMLLKNENGDMPLHLAAGTRVIEEADGTLDFGSGNAILPIIESLGAKGCNAVNNKGETPLHCAAGSGNWAAVYQLLQPNRSNPAPIANNGHTALDYACFAFYDSKNMYHVKTITGEFVDSRIKILRSLVHKCNVSKDTFPWQSLPETRRDEIREILFPKSS